MLNALSYVKLLMLGVCCVPTICLAQERVERPSPKVGDTWQFKMSVSPGEKISTFSRQVLEIGADGTMRLKQGNGAFMVDAFLNPVDEKGAEYTPIVLKFPMSVGTQWTYNLKAGPQGAFEHRGTYKVLAFESVVVTAGTFDCFRVEGTSDVTARRYQKSTQDTYWYCPKINYVGKRQWTTNTQAGDTPSTSEQTSVELVKFTPGG